MVAHLLGSAGNPRTVLLSSGSRPASASISAKSLPLGVQSKTNGQKGKGGREKPE